MAVWHREFVYNQIKDFYKKQNEDPNMITKDSIQKPSSIKLPDFVAKPDAYVVKKKNS